MIAWLKNHRLISLLLLFGLAGLVWWGWNGHKDDKKNLPPMKVVTILSGVVSFSLPLFIISAIIARGARFYGLAWLLRRYGTAVLAFVERRMGWIVGGILVAAVLLYWILHR